jgi:hypothetical protein
MRDWTEEDRQQRERLERNSSAGQRVNMAAVVNDLAKVHGNREMPGLSAYGVIRLMQHNGGAQGREARRHNRAHEAFERLHPDSPLRRAAAPAAAAEQRPDVEEVVSIEDMARLSASLVRASRYW